MKYVFAFLVLSTVVIAQTSQTPATFGCLKLSW